MARLFIKSAFHPGEVLFVVKAHRCSQGSFFSKLKFNLMKFNEKSRVCSALPWIRSVFDGHPQTICDRPRTSSVAKSTTSVLPMNSQAFHYLKTTTPGLAKIQSNCCQIAVDRNLFISTAILLFLPKSFCNFR